MPTPDAKPHSVAQQIVDAETLPDYPDLAELARGYLSLEEQLEAEQRESQSAHARLAELDGQLEAAREEVLFLCSDEDDIRKRLREQLEAANERIARFERILAQEGVTALDYEEGSRLDRIATKLDAVLYPVTTPLPRQLSAATQSDGSSPARDSS